MPNNLYTIAQQKLPTIRQLEEGDAVDVDVEEGRPTTTTTRAVVKKKKKDKTKKKSTTKSRYHPYSSSQALVPWGGGAGSIVDPYSVIEMMVRQLKNQHDWNYDVEATTATSKTNREVTAMTTTDGGSSNSSGSNSSGLSRRKKAPESPTETVATKSTTKSPTKSTYGGSDDGMTASTSDRIAKLEEEISLLNNKLNGKLDKRGLEIRLNKGDMMTQYAGQWLLGVLCVFLGFCYVYYIVRRQLGPVQDPQARLVFLLGSYCSLYIFMTLLDIFHNTVWNDKAAAFSCPKTTEKTHVIVAAHKAADSLRDMLPHILNTFDPKCVWVADNGWRDHEAERICDELGVNYRFNSFGNKANALLVVARHIQRTHGDQVKNVMLLDDDTIIPEGFFIRHDLLAKKHVAGYCVGIGIQRSPPKNIWEIAIDYEYRSISYGMAARAAKGTMRFAHGIAAVYKLDVMVDMYKMNLALPGGLPFGEDGWAGSIMRQHGYKIVQDNANLVLTYCPRRFFPPMMCMGGESRAQGYGADSLVKQRGERWYMNWVRHLSTEARLFVTYNCHSVWGNIVYRIYMLYWLFLNVTSVTWLPYWILVWTNPSLSYMFVWQLKAALTLTSIIVAWIRVIAFPSKLSDGIHPLAPFFAPVLGTAKTFLRFYAFFRSVLWYIPFRRPGKLEVIGDEGDLDYPPMVVKAKSLKGLSRESLTPTETEADDSTVMSDSSPFVLDPILGDEEQEESFDIDIGPEPSTSTFSSLFSNRINTIQEKRRFDGPLVAISNGPSRRFESLHDTANVMAYSSQSSLESYRDDYMNDTDNESVAHVLDKV